MIANLLFNKVRHCAGSDELTAKVLKQIRLKSPEPAIAVFGSGTGEQVFLLAKKYPKVTVTAVDPCSLYFPELQKKAAK